MLTDSPNFRATSPASDGRLIKAELRLRCRAKVVGDDSPEQPPETRRELQGPHARRLLRTWILEDPDEKVKGWSKYLVQLRIPHVCHVQCLPQEAGDEADAWMVGLVGLAVSCKRTAKRGGSSPALGGATGGSGAAGSSG